MITGAALGLPGTDEVFDDANVGRILDGHSFIDTIPVGLRNAIVDKHIIRLVKSESGGGSFETIESADEVIKLAGRKGHLDLVADFGYPEDRLAALDSTSQLAIAAGIDALRDAGIPLVMHYKTTTTGSKLPERWGLPSHLRDGTGVIFASAFPGYDRLVDEITRFEQDHARRQRLHDLEHLRERVSDDDPVIPELDHMVHEVRADIEQHPYQYDRRFIFKVLSMGHSQFAEYIGARGPNTQVNAACASTTQAVALAEDWIRLGRCERVIVIAADDVTNDTMLPWIGTGFLATGAAATDDVVEEAALPFDRRRHGMIVGMGAAAIVVEDRAAARARGLDPICEVLSSVVANSAFHGTRLDVSHICDVMENLVADAERRWGLDRRQLAGEMVFVSHETYTPARGGSAQAEVDALRHVFGANADAIVVANSKGFTGHAMGAGIEDVLAVKALETGIVPPIANVKEVDPDLGHLNLSKGGRYPVRYALRLGAGFGSQISMSLMRWSPTPSGARPEADELGYTYRVNDSARWAAWLREVSGYEGPELEIVGRTLRVRDEGPAAETDTPGDRPQRIQPAPTPAAPSAPSAPAPAPAAPSAPSAVAAAGGQAPAGPDPTAPVVDPVEVRVLEVVAEQTGYPPEMLDLELDLEADLGIDTVKQAETFAAIREEYGIERDDNLSLRDYPTLASVVGFVRDRATGLPPVPTTTAPAPAATGGQTPPGSDPLATARHPPPPSIPSSTRSLPSSPNRPATRPRCSTSNWTSKPTSASTPSNKPKPSPPSARNTASNATTTSPSATTPPSPRSSASSATAPPDSPNPHPPRHLPAPAATGGQTPPGSDPLATSPAPAPAVDPVVDKVLAVVAEQTGYPPEMLDLELDLEADLGIDTVKQAETFAAIREEYGIERDDNLSLRDYPTLASVVGFVRDRATGLPRSHTHGPGTAAAPHLPLPGVRPRRGQTLWRPAPAPAPAVDPVVDKVLAVVAEQTGYPPEMLDLELDLEADLGIDTVKQAETFAAIREEYGIERDDNLSLRDYPTLASVVGFVRDRATGLPPVPTHAPAPGTCRYRGSDPSGVRPPGDRPGRHDSDGRRRGLGCDSAPPGHQRAPPRSRALRRDRHHPRSGQPPPGHARRGWGRRRTRQEARVARCRRPRHRRRPIGGRPREPDRPVASRRSRARDLLAAGPGHRGSRGRDGSGRVERSPARQGEAAVPDAAPSVRDGGRARHVPRVRHPPGRTPRLRRRGSGRPHGRRRGRRDQDLQAGAARRAGESRRLRSQSEDGRPGRPPHRRDRARSRRGRGGPPRRRALHRHPPGTADAGRARRAGTGLRFGVRRHRRRREHRVGDHRGPGSSVARRVPPARSGPRARPRRPRSDRLRYGP